MKKQQQGAKLLLEFKAGKLNFDGRIVKPDRRKGMIRLVEDSQGTKQFQFCDMESKAKIDGYYVFPGDCKFEKVK